jgi:hypothetical protein
MSTKFPPWFVGIVLLLLAFLLKETALHYVSKNEAIDKAVIEMRLAAKDLQRIIDLHRAEFESERKRVSESIITLQAQAQTISEGLGRKLDALADRQQQIEVLLRGRPPVTQPAYP